MLAVLGLAAAPAILAAREAVPEDRLAAASAGRVHVPLVAANARFAPVTPPPPAPPATVTPAVATAQSTAPGPVPPAGWTDDLLARINAARAAHGLPPLALDPSIARAAQAHAGECARKGWCGHEGADGSTVRERLERAGAGPLLYWGENWTWSDDPAGAFTFWYDEPPGADPHRRNLLSPRYTHAGIGIAPAPRGGWFFICDFAARP